MTAIERLVALVRRELHADDVRITDASVPASAAANVISARLSDGRHVAVVFASKPENADALERRLDMLIKTFTQSLEHDARGTVPSRPSPARSLQEELRALATRARAVDAVVIDAKSPVLWGSAAVATEHVEPAGDRLALVQVAPGGSSRAQDISRKKLVDAPASSGDPMTQDTDVDAESDDVRGAVPDEGRARLLAERAASAVRALPGIAQLSKGRYLTHAVREDNFGYVAHSFASIYIVVLVFDGRFDDLRAERALVDALPRVERLVLALPPLDPRPAPIAGVVSLRRARKR